MISDSTQNLFIVEDDLIRSKYFPLDYQNFHSFPTSQLYVIAPINNMPKSPRKTSQSAASAAESDTPKTEDVPKRKYAAEVTIFSSDDSSSEISRKTLKKKKVKTHG